jgi:hypothetical protein
VSREIVSVTEYHRIKFRNDAQALQLNSDGTTATSPDGTRTLHSHGPPPRQAA